jgi:hypothetical protein
MLSSHPGVSAGLALALLTSAAISPAYAQSTPDYEKAPINYSASEPQDAVARLRARIANRQVTINGSEREQLLAVLAALEVPESTQVLVFSKTSLQRGRIHPRRPRALYFSDSIYVGWVPGGLIEVAAVDPQLGPIFYSFDPRAAEPAARTFVRDPDCLRCHGGAFVRDIPGVFARSVVPSDTGEPLFRFGTEVIDDTTPFARRWGGWYVTGYTGSEDHRGNAFGSDTADTRIFPVSHRRPRELSEFFETADYPAATSDVVALLVLEHQLTMQNSLTRASLSARKMIAYQHSLQKAFHEPATDEPAYDSVKSVFRSVTEDVVDRLLFRQAAPLPAGVEGDRAFREAFARTAVRGQTGRTLKDLQLADRIFALRCSYLVYSETFRGLPGPLKRQILERLRMALEDDSPDSRYAYLPKDERRQIFELLRETHPDAQAHWSDS